jgi:hypothetical protein
MSRVSADHRQSMGIDWLDCKAEAIVRDGKIAAHTVVLTAESVAKLETGM